MVIHKEPLLILPRNQRLLFNLFLSALPVSTLSLAVLLLFASSLCASQPARAGETDAVQLSDSNGLHITASQVLDNRMMDVTFTTSSLVVPATVRIVLPTGYATGNRRYPVIYLLHGGGGDHTQWTDLGAEQDTANTPVILIQPDGGKGSWYANAEITGADGHRPLWETYLIDQLIPWVDAHLHTEADRDGRAIAGLSMGGYGTMSYAARHPDLFVSASAFSGAVDTSGDLVANWIGVSPLIDNRLPYTIFGLYPVDTHNRLAHNPLTLATNLRGMHLAFYYGNGNAGPLDNNPGLPNPVAIFMGWIQENQVYQMNINMNNTLNALGIPHEEHYYGNGMHSAGYWARDFQQELPVIMATFAHPPMPANIAVDGGFEQDSNSPWQCNGSCGTDRYTGYAHTGNGNGWVRNWIGWNDIHQTVTVAAHTPYHLSGWIQTSANNRNGYFGVRTTSGTVVAEQHFARLDGYTRISLDIDTGDNTRLVIYGGTWAVGDTWVRLDDVSLTPGQ